MAHTLIISDLHLSESHPETTDQFFHFMLGVAPQAEALYILGDLFDYWAGDDDLDTPFHKQVCSAFSTLANGGTRIYIMHGNRDFLMGKALAKACNAQLLNDPTLIALYGRSTLLTHGDTLCTGDRTYQEFRTLVRAPDWQSQFLTQPLTQRKTIIEQLRAESEKSKRDKSMDIMDVSEDAVLGMLREYNYPRLIHGHTHRPAKHNHHLDDRDCERWVLGDWDNEANALQVDPAGIHHIKFR